MRLDRFIANNTGLSRRETQIAIRRGTVTINGIMVRDTATLLTGQESILLAGEKIDTRGPRYLMLYKPQGVVSVTSDATHPTALDLLPLDEKSSLQIAGRLDLDTTGLLLLTDDGQWNHRVTAPATGKTKRYRVTTQNPLELSAIDAFAEGIQLRHEKRPTRPAVLEITGEREALVILCEGKYHQVKRMFAAIGHHVVALHREAIGDIMLDPALAPGDYRLLTQQEIDSV